MANKQIFLDFNASMTDSITISGLALRIYLKDFYNNNIPNIDKGSLYRDIKQGYTTIITLFYISVTIMRIFKYLTRCLVNTSTAIVCFNF